MPVGSTVPEEEVKVKTERVDCHVHLRGPDDVASLEAIRDHVGLDRMNIVCTMGRDSVNANPAAFVAKAEFPERFYVFAGLDHSTCFSDGRVQAPSLAEQVDRLRALGADGIKMIENKPTSRKMLDIPVDSEYFEAYFAHVEETGFPVLWHVSDPEEFWDPDKTPAWAASRGWGYDDTFVQKETLYAEVERVLERHPKLRIVFAHFYFLSADLPRAAALLDRFDGVRLDLAPGIEMLYNMSRDVSETRAFFQKYADRIVFGTDLFSSHALEEARIRSGIVTRWLETDEEYRVPEAADLLLGPPEDGVIRGLSLPSAVISRICRENFEALTAPTPRPLDRTLAAEECERIACEIDALRGERVEENYARAAAARLRG